MAALLINCLPDVFDIFSDDDGYVITVPALEAVDGFRFVTLDVRLSEIEFEYSDTFEFSYGFTISDLDGLEPSYFTQDRYDVERYFGDNSREGVMPAVCACIDRLVDHVQPGYIYRVTKGRNLPQRAFQKHDLVTQALVDLGFYEVQSGTDQFNRTFWVMSR